MYVNYNMYSHKVSNSPGMYFWFCIILFCCKIPHWLKYFFWYHICQMYFIHRGDVDVTSEDGSIIFDVMRAGQSFGEVALLFSCPRTACIRLLSGFKGPCVFLRSLLSLLYQPLPIFSLLKIISRVEFWENFQWVINYLDNNAVTFLCLRSILDLSFSQETAPPPFLLTPDIFHCIWGIFSQVLYQKIILGVFSITFPFFFFNFHCTHL